MGGETELVGSRTREGGQESGFLEVVLSLLQAPGLHLSSFWYESKKSNELANGSRRTDLDFHVSHPDPGAQH